MRTKRSVSRVFYGKLPLRHGVLLAAIVREGRIIIPGGMTTIEPGDHVLVVTNVTGLTDLKHILA